MNTLILLQRTAEQRMSLALKQNNSHCERKTDRITVLMSTAYFLPKHREGRYECFYIFSLHSTVGHQ